MWKAVFYRGYIDYWQSESKNFYKDEGLKVILILQEGCNEDLLYAPYEELD